MRRLSLYVRKYGLVEGQKMHRRLQRLAALESAHARHKKSLARKPPTPPTPPLKRPQQRGERQV
jgi:hypothetical protein